MTHERDGKHHRGREYPRVNEREQKQGKLLDGHEVVNDRLRATIEGQRAEIAALKFEVKRLTGLDRMLSERNRWHVHDVDMLRAEKRILSDVNDAQAAEIVTLTAEVARYRKWAGAL